MTHLLNIGGLVFVSPLIKIEEGVEFTPLNKNTVSLSGDTSLTVTVTKTNIYRNGNKGKLLLNILGHNVYSDLRYWGYFSPHHLFELSGTGQLKKDGQPSNSQLYLMIEFDRVKEEIKEVVIVENLNDFI